MVESSGLSLQGGKGVSGAGGEKELLSQSLEPEALAFGSLLSTLQRVIAASYIPVRATDCCSRPKRSSAQQAPRNSNAPQDVRELVAEARSDRFQNLGPRAAHSRYKWSWRCGDGVEGAPGCQRQQVPGLTTSCPASSPGLDLSPEFLALHFLTLRGSTLPVLS